MNVVGEKTSWNVSFTTVTAIPAGGLVVINFPVKAIYAIAGVNMTIVD